MESTQPNFNCDETPTPTRFIRNCEEVGLFQDLQQINPFEVSFGNAVQSSSQTTVRSLPEPLGKAAEVDTLDTPQVVPNAKRIEYFQNTCDFMEEDAEDVLKLPNNYLEQILPNEYYQTSVTETKTQQTTVVKVNIQNDSKVDDKKNAEPENNFVDLTMSPDPSYAMKMQTTHSKVVKEVIYEREEQNILNKTITNEFLILHKDKKQTKENVHTTVTPNYGAISFNGELSSHSPTIITNKNILLIPASTVVNSSKKYPVEIHPKPEISELTAKQKLKKLLKSNENNDIPTATNEIANCQNSSPNVESKGDKLTYFRERNRIAQKRCRMRKKKLISQLKQTTQSVYEENKSLRSEVSSLKTEIAQLKTLLLAHKDCPVTQAMCKTDVSNMLSKNSVSNNHQQKSQILPHSKGICNANMVKESQNLLAHKAAIDPNRELMVFDSKTIPITKSTDKNDAEKKPPLKVIIGETTKRKSKVTNSPNAVKVICFHHDSSEVTDLTYDSS